MFVLPTHQHIIYLYKEILRNNIHLKYILDPWNIREYPNVRQCILVPPPYSTFSEMLLFWKKKIYTVSVIWCAQPGCVNHGRSPARANAHLPFLFAYSKQQLLQYWRSTPDVPNKRFLKYLSQDDSHPATKRLFHGICKWGGAEVVAVQFIRGSKVLETLFCDFRLNLHYQKDTDTCLGIVVSHPP